MAHKTELEEWPVNEGPARAVWLHIPLIISNTNMYCIATSEIWAIHTYTIHNDAQVLFLLDAKYLYKAHNMSLCINVCLKCHDWKFKINETQSFTLPNIIESMLGSTVGLPEDYLTTKRATTGNFWHIHGKGPLHLTLFPTGYTFWWPPLLNPADG